jgi:hypothetical protein
MLAMIPNDFKVRPIFQSAGSSLFATRREDIWHFVLATTRKISPNHESIDIGQFHWPRYSVARALAANAGAECPAMIRELGFTFGAKAATLSLGGVVYPLPAGIIAEIREDVDFLKRSSSKVVTGVGGFQVADATTSRGHTVVAESKCLAEAIAFERETRHELELRRFGVYSAFCTWRDFLRDDSSRREIISAGMAQEMIGWDPGSIGDDAYWDSVFTIQESLWGTRIWGPEVDAEQEVLNDAFSRAFERLSSIQFAQFVLMNGMHRGGPFHPLAALLGLSNFADYKHWRTRKLQPDSQEEQIIRTQSSFIELLDIGDH